MTIGFRPSIKNATPEKVSNSWLATTISWQCKKMSQGQPHPHVFLKCETILFVMNGMQQMYFFQNQLALKKPSFNDGGQSYQ
jgi:hypothetical protein